MRWTRSRWLALGLGLALAACAEDETPEASGAPMPGGAAHAVERANRPPQIRSVRLEPAQPRPGDLLDARVELFDAEGDAVRLVYRWRVDGRPVDGAASFHVGVVPKGTRIEVEVLARDASGESPPATASVRVANRPPVLLGVAIEPLGTVTRAQDVVAKARARDPERDELEFLYRWSVNGQPVDSAGARLPRDRFKRGDRIEFEVVASDGNDQSEPLRSQSFEVENAAPQIVSEPSDFAADGSFQYELIAEDPDGDTSLRLRLVEGPQGMKLDRESRLLTWQPTREQRGEYPVAIEVQDAHGGSSRQEFALNHLAGQSPAAPAR